jgi:hypothetical protein
MHVSSTTLGILVVCPSILWDGPIDIRRHAFFLVEYENTDHFLLLDRAQKSLGLVNGAPDYTPVAGFMAPDVPAKTQTYSVDGRLYAYALPNV